MRQRFKQIRNVSCLEPRTESNSYRFELPIGDWSGDGHRQCEYRTIESNLPLQEVRDIYWEATIRLGVSLDERHGNLKTPCGRYQQETFEVDWLEKAQLTLTDVGLNTLEDGFVYGSVELFVRMFIAFVMKHGADKGVQLKVSAQQCGRSQGTFTWYSTDEKGRHIGFFGYGIFQ